MTSSPEPLPGLDFEPERERIIDDVETLKIYFDPLRLRIVQQVAEQARSIHQIAAALGMPFTRLYYHIHLLEKVGILKHVETRYGAGAIEEKYYRVAAWFFAVDRSLMMPGTPQGDSGLETVIATVLDETRRSIYASIDAGEIDTAQRVPHPDALLILRGVFALTPEQAMEFQTRLKALIIEFNQHQSASADPARSYNFALAFHPAVLDTKDE